MRVLFFDAGIKESAIENLLDETEDASQDVLTPPSQTGP